MKSKMNVRKIILISLIIILILYIMISPDNGAVIELKYMDGTETHLNIDVIVYKPWKEDSIIHDIEERKMLLHKAPDTMTVNMCLLKKRYKYKTINISYEE